MAAREEKESPRFWLKSQFRAHQRIASSPRGKTRMGVHWLIVGYLKERG